MVRVRFLQGHPRIALVILSALVPCAAFAQTWPGKSIRFIVPAAAAGPSDFQARLVVAHLSDVLAQPVIVDNRAGAGGEIGMEIAAQAPADGYTMVIGAGSTLAVRPMMPRKPRYDAINDFTPITLMSSAPYVVTAYPGLRAATLKDLVANARAKPRSLTYGTSGSGSGIHLVTEMFLMTAGIEGVHVPYKGAAPVNVALLAGEVDVLFNTAIPAIGYVKSKRLRGLAVTSAQRLPAIPDVPTIAEVGYPGFDYTSWQGIVVRSGTSSAIVSRLNKEIVRILNLPDVKARIEEQGNTVSANSPEQFGEFIRSEMAKWGKVIKAVGVKE